jgi:hypothetical protein
MSGQWAENNVKRKVVAYCEANSWGVSGGTGENREHSRLGLKAVYIQVGTTFRLTFSL